MFVGKYQTYETVPYSYERDAIKDVTSYMKSQSATGQFTIQTLYAFTPEVITNLVVPADIVNLISGKMIDRYGAQANNYLKNVLNAGISDSRYERPTSLEALQEVTNNIREILAKWIESYQLYPDFERPYGEKTYMLESDDTVWEKR